MRPASFGHDVAEEALSRDSHPVAWAGRQAVITLPEEIDTTNSGQVHTVLLQTVDDGATALVADMTGTVFCASAGIQVLVNVHKAAVAAGAGLRVAVVSPMVRRVLELTGATHLLDIYPDLDAALAGAASGTAPASQQPPPLS